MEYLPLLLVLRAGPSVLAGVGLAGVGVIAVLDVGGVHHGLDEVDLVPADPDVADAALEASVHAHGGSQRVLFLCEMT